MLSTTVLPAFGVTGLVVAGGRVWAPTAGGFLIGRRALAAHLGGRSPPVTDRRKPSAGEAQLTITGPARTAATRSA